MINTSLNLQGFLAANTGVIALAADRIWANIDLPPSYAPKDGPAVLVYPRGGTFDHTALILTESFNIQCFGLEPANAWDLYRAIVDALQYASSFLFNIKGADLEQSAVPLQDPETQWFYTLAFYQVMFVNV